jgi:O-methyltransferase
MGLKGTLLNQVRKVVRPHHIRKLAYYLAAPYELVAGPLTYNQDGLATIHNCDFIHDARFAKAYAKGKSTGSWGPVDLQWRAFVACWAADKARHLEGDFVECGVNRGGLARTVIEYVDFPTLDKKFYLLDTFCGLVERYVSEAEKERGITPGGYEECYDAVKETFAGFNVELIRGTVPDTLPQVTTEKVCYLSIDMNCALPELAAAEFFWDKLVSGAVMLLDDYGWDLHTEQHEVFDQFAARKDVLVLSLPTGQGLIVKP